MKQPACLECEKLSKVADESNKIGEFLEWLQKQHVTLCQWNDRFEEYEPHDLDGMDFNHLLAEYYNIDLDKVEEERRELLRWLQTGDKE